MNTRGRPGMLAPTYQELQVDRSDTLATSLTCSTQAPRPRAWARSTARRCPHVRHAVDHPVDMLLDRLDHAGQHGRAAGPVMVKKLGKPADRQAEIGPRSGAPLLGERQAVAAGDPDLSNDPVIAAKPVAQTTASSGCSTPFTSMPSS